MLADFTIKNFRGIKELTLPSLKRVNLFVGKNGVGKTSVLEAVDVWAQTLSPHALWSVLAQRSEVLVQGDVRLILTRLFLDAKEPLSLGPVRRENEFRLNHGGTYSFSFDKGPHQLTTDFGTRIHGSRRISSSFLPARGLAPGSIATLWEQVASKRWDPATAVRSVIPSVEDAVMVPKGGTIVPLVGLPGQTERVPLQSLGDGAVRLFELSLSLMSVAGGLLLIDEIENGIHYSAMTDVWRLILAEAAKHNVQVFATTHSRDTVYALAEASKDEDHIVYRIERYKGVLQAIEFGQDQLNTVAEFALEIR